MRDIVGQKFVGPCPWCYEPLTLEVPYGVMRHASPVCKAFQFHSASCILDNTYELINKLAHA